MEISTVACVNCGDYIPAYRTHFMDRYAASGAEYGMYSPAYELGHQYAHDHKGLDWSRSERDLRKLWESRGQNPWDDVRDAVHFGWSKAI